MNYAKIVNYAYLYWYSYNDQYRRFSQDCTNFISQALRAGGWPDDKGWYKSSGNWWYTGATQSYTWAGTENWSHFAPKRTSYLKSTYDLVASDIMLMDNNRNNVMDHGMIVTYKNSTQPYFTYHTTDTVDKSMKSIYTDRPNAWYYAYRT